MRSRSSCAISMRRPTRPCCNWPVLPARWRSSYDDSDQAQDRFDEPVTASVLAKATARGRQRRHPGLHALSVAYLPVKNYPELSALGVAELEGLAIGYGGTALCLEARDLHVSIAGLVSASQPLMDLAATVIAVRNGSRRTEAKAQASRENGRKGGRPRKAEAA